MSCHCGGNLYHWLCLPLHRTVPTQRQKRDSAARHGSIRATKAVALLTKAASPDHRQQDGGSSTAGEVSVFYWDTSRAQILNSIVS